MILEIFVMKYLSEEATHRVFPEFFCVFFKITRNFVFVVSVVSGPIWAMEINADFFLAIYRTRIKFLIFIFLVPF